MKKLYILAVALSVLSMLISTGAFADTTITIEGPFHCYNTGLCYQPPTDSATAVVDYVQLTCGFECMAVSVDGKRYYATDIVPIAGTGAWAVDGAVLYAADGTSLRLTAAWTLQTKLGSSGRAHYWIHIYNLLSGTITLN